MDLIVRKINKYVELAKYSCPLYKHLPVASTIFLIFMCSVEP